MGDNVIKQPKITSKDNTWVLEAPNKDVVTVVMPYKDDPETVVKDNELKVKVSKKATSNKYTSKYYRDLLLNQLGIFGKAPIRNFNDISMAINCLIVYRDFKLTSSDLSNTVRLADDITDDGGEFED